MNGKFTFDRVFIIAEAGVNHNGDIRLAYKLVDAAKEAGADAVKFQTFKAENVVSKIAEKAEYQRETTNSEESQYEMIKKLELSFEDFVKIKDYCDKKGIIFLSTPFDYESVDFLENFVPVYKIGSGEITNLPFLEYIAKKGKPIILSTGMSTLGEVEEAVKTIINVNSSLPLVLLHCVSSYPAKYEDVNLKVMLTLKEAFELPVGYSDHTLGIEIPIAAVALGAKIIEKHFTLDRGLPGPDHKASLEPDELKKMVKAIRNVEKALGSGVKKPAQSELKVMKVARRSIVAAGDIRAGEVVKESDIFIKRPGTGIPPKFKEIIIGMRLTRDVKKDNPFNWEDFK
ncbi:MAG TPA: N-acetylneuraminate synthase [candidate division WOR-3 bacterium]|uniref:N-acetylneuraminate synthase n=1 Tax=candidate division WOR-3 bacterium TaxID=2052148 RepID=A0A7C5DB10_UNCW3|nr:N-acetylneuraminate synthase [candidate division WOR-3 bacterium]